MQKRWLTGSALIIAGLILAACGTVAEEPRPTFEPPPTFDLSIRNVETDGEEVAVQPTDTPQPTEVPPTDTPEPTEVVPTDTPEPTEALPTDTPAPTEIPATNPPETAGDIDPASVGDPANGEQLFVNNPVQPCNACHRVDTEDMLVGPGLLNIKDRAGERIEGQTAIEYLYNSIAHPNDYIVESFPPVMPVAFGTTLTEQQINDLVAYLLTLE